MEKKPRKRRVSDLIARLGAEEDEFLRRDFLAPSIRRGRVRVKIAGAVCELKIQPADYLGWGVFRPTSHAEAVLVREATLRERRDYLRLFPLIRLIVCRRAGSRWLGTSASFGDSRIRLEGLAPIQLEEPLQLFDCVCVRYDGSQFWFDEIDPRHSPATSAYLRGALDVPTPPEDLARPGLTAEERAAYEVNYWHLMRPPEEPQSSPEGTRRESLDLNESDIVRARLRESLSRTGADLIDYLERADGYTVTYSIGTRRFTSSVAKDDLTVQVAGICLEGTDHLFDLNSLVGVLREGERDSLIYEMNDSP